MDYNEVRLIIELFFEERKQGVIWEIVWFCRQWKVEQSRDCIHMHLTWMQIEGKIKIATYPDRTVYSKI